MGIYTYTYTYTYCKNDLDQCMYSELQRGFGLFYETKDSISSNIALSLTRS